jgi:hypothetical protein
MGAPQEITVKITSDRSAYTAEEIEEMLNDAVCIGWFKVEEIEEPEDAE